MIDKLPEGWKKVKLGDILSNLTDYHANGSYKVLKKNVELLDNKNYAVMIRTTNFEKSDFSDLKYITKEAYDFLAKSKVFSGDIVMNKIANAGSCYYVPNLNSPMSLGMNLFLLRIVNTVNQYYVYLYLKQNEKYIKTFANGTTTTTITKQSVKNLDVLLPTYKEQSLIVSVVSSFDKKIKLLKEQNKKLEIMAQTIFKEWFVDFNYPNATGEIIDSQMGKIPKGWRAFKLEELVDTVNGYSYKGKELVEQSDEALVTLKSFNRNGGFQTRGFKPFKGNPKAQQEVKIGDLVVAHTDLTQDAEVLGNPAFIFEDGGFKKMYITMDLVKVVSKIKDIDNAFLYYIMKDRRFKGHCVGYSNGTTVLHLSKKAIPEYKIALPQDLKLAKEFSNLVYSFTNKISNNIVQLKTLEDMRDRLLPKLMSGKLRVKEFSE